MNAFYLGLVATAALAAPATTAAAAPSTNPMDFFEGRTEGTGTMRIVFRKPFHSKSVGQGTMRGGTMTLVQRVEEAGKPAHDRRWIIRRIGAKRFTGTMSDAVGPVTIDEIGGRYRFRFKMKGHLSVQQWLIPLPGGTAARNSVTIRKLGMTVGSGDGMIRKVAGR